MFGPPQDRRTFVRRLSVGGAALAMGRGAVSQTESSWAKRISTAKYKMCFDASAIGQAIALANIAHYLDGYAELGVHEADVCPVLVLRQNAAPLALSDAFWEHHAMGRSLGIIDVSTHTAIAHNPYLRGEAAAHPEAPALEGVMKRGALVLVCSIALAAMSASVAKREQSDEAAVLDDARRSLVQGAALVPSGVFALGHAQQLGCGYMKSS